MMAEEQQYATGNCDKKIYDDDGPILGLMMGEQRPGSIWIWTK